MQLRDVMILLAVVLLASFLSDKLVFTEKLDAAFLSDDFDTDDSRNPPAADNAATESLVTLLNRLAAHNKVQLPQPKAQQKQSSEFRADIRKDRHKQTNVARTYQEQVDQTRSFEGSGSDSNAELDQPGDLGTEGSGFDYNPH
ncbi:uncharacterized protein LOC111268152 isoform X2 [Varroa jacobsoni]|uniref:Uncharacterized protein n=1 Tax=Varroa destructor TaxID=109461 RepID=A0A7M7KRA8_VARDE|nr:uncharacterized protein LOC111254341 isoform X2 [Varroa destructor]XP_022702662.1 uncharacterized protein LOC111268152 isoform X2 [Varroa jacobsoni]